MLRQQFFLYSDIVCNTAYVCCLVFVLKAVPGLKNHCMCTFFYQSMYWNFSGVEVPYNKVTEMCVTVTLAL